MDPAIVLDSDNQASRALLDLERAFLSASSRIHGLSSSMSIHPSQGFANLYLALHDLPSLVATHGQHSSLFSNALLLKLLHFFKDAPDNTLRFLVVSACLGLGRAPTA